MHPTPAALEERLRSEIAEVEAFIGLLGEERTVLLAGDADALPAITARKYELAQRLAARGSARAGLRIACADAPAQAAPLLNRLMDRLLACAARAKADGEQNGTLVALRLQHASSALAVLVGGASRVPAKSTPPKASRAPAPAGAASRRRDSIA